MIWRGEWFILFKSGLHRAYVALIEENAAADVAAPLAGTALRLPAAAHGDGSPPGVVARTHWTTALRDRGLYAVVRVEQPKKGAARRRGRFRAEFR